VSTSRRNVVASSGLPSTITVTVPWAIPVGATRKPAARARFVTTSGSAVVARSKSPTAAPSARSRTAPPTSRVSSPSPFSASLFAPRGHGAYIPAHLENGVLVPGRIE